MLESNVSLKPFNTFGVPAIASNYLKITQEHQLQKLFDSHGFPAPNLTLGGGSNVLFTKNYSGCVIHMQIKGIQHFIEGSNIYVTAGGGEIWNDLVWYCVDRGFGGLENMALIPGTVGASPVQNIGAYGAELMSFFHSCRAFDKQSGEFVTFNNQQCKFSYRDSIFKTTYKDRFIITSVTYKLSLNHQINTSYGAINQELQKRGITSPTIQDVAEVVSHIRVEKLPDPSTVGNAGSFFKNPIISREQHDQLKEQFQDLVSYQVDASQFKIAAGWLIEQCGYKGKTFGQVGVWKNQALVLVNKGQAKGIEVYQLSEEIAQTVYNKFNITLEREVNIL